jgi:galactokinase
MMQIPERVVQAYEQQFGDKPTLVVQSPGRVNLIGEHTDYNDGFVLPMAIDRSARIALRPRDDRQVVVYSLDFEESATFGLEGLTKPEGDIRWVDYLTGMAWVLSEAGYTVNGWEGVIAGDVPVGAGLSSSAAVEMVTARAFLALSGTEWEAGTMAKLGQKTENEWVGVNSGIMDQMISAAGKAGHALLIDCRTLETQSLPLPDGCAVVVLDTATRRGLVSTAYNERRAQCEAAARHFGVKALRDVTVATFNERSEELDDVTRRRAKHVITENARTLHAADAMTTNDGTRLGKLMVESHISLRDDFEVSSPALNAIVEISLATEGCIGARMTGGGFGGCAVALVSEAAAQTFMDTVVPEYQRQTGHTPALYLCYPSEGASIIYSAL